MERFRWEEWNEEHATRHGCTREEIELVVEGRVRGYPRKIGGGKWMTEARGHGGRMVRVVFFRDPDRTVVVIHAMPLTTRHRR
jgi:hypothetical protein